MKIITFRFHIKLFLWIATGFIICTIVGVLSHELGHAAAASAQDRDWTLHYASLSPGRAVWSYQLEAEYRKNEDKIKSNVSSPEKEAYLKLRKDIAKKYRNEDLYMRLGGPVQTMLTAMAKQEGKSFCQFKYYAMDFCTVGLLLVTAARNTTTKNILFADKPQGDW